VFDGLLDVTPLDLIFRRHQRGSPPTRSCAVIPCSPLRPAGFMAVGAYAVGDLTQKFFVHFAAALCGRMVA